LNDENQTKGFFLDRTLWNVEMCWKIFGGCHSIHFL
jgi:hypothetical protein